MPCAAARAAGARVVGFGESAAADVRLVITDISMPGFDGPALVSALRRFQPDLKVLFISGGADGPVRASGIPQANFLTKPFKPEALLAKVREMLKVK